MTDYLEYEMYIGERPGHLEVYGRIGLIAVVHDVTHSPTRLHGVISVQHIKNGQEAATYFDAAAVTYMTFVYDNPIGDES